MKIGDLVYLKSDLKCKTPMTIQRIDTQMSENGYYEVAFCKWLNAQKVSNVGYFSLDTLQGSLEIKKNKFKKIPLLFANGVYGFKVYSSLLASNWKDNQETKNDFEKDTRFVYNFKKYGKNKELIRQLIELLAFDLGCTDIVGVPSHTTEPNEIQLLLNSHHFTRIKETAARKYNHTHPLQSDYQTTYQTNLGTLAGNCILLVDDGSVSGATLAHFAEVLQQGNCQVFKLALGLDVKLQPEKVKDLIVSL